MNIEHVPGMSPHIKPANVVLGLLGSSKEKSEDETLLFKKLCRESDELGSINFEGTEIQTLIDFILTERKVVSDPDMVKVLDVSLDILRKKL